MQRGVVRAQVDRALHEIGGGGVLALLMAQDAEQMQGVDVDGVGGEGREVIARGVVESTVTMRRPGAVKYRLHDGGEGSSVRQTPHFPTLGAAHPD